MERDFYIVADSSHKYNQLNSLYIKNSKAMLNLFVSFESIISINFPLNYLLKLQSFTQPQQYKQIPDTYFRTYMLMTIFQIKSIYMRI